jgi:2-phospho-L-lactate guanylyltransferase
VIWALIPVKELSQAKARLAPALDEAGRRALTLAMLRDVLDAALACPALNAVAVTSRDEEALAIAKAAGATPLPEPGALNEALASATERLRERGAARLLVLAADLPLADAESIGAVISDGAEVVVVPSRDGGTNALALAPGALPFRYGPGSAQAHLAASAGLRARRLELPALALDIDTPADLDRLRDAATLAGKHTSAALARLGLAPTSARRG